MAAKVKARVLPARKRTRKTHPKKADDECPDGKLLLPSWITAGIPVQISRVASHWHLEKKSGLNRPTRPLMKSERKVLPMSEREVLEAWAITKATHS